MSASKEGGMSYTDDDVQRARGWVEHATTAYPFARTVGCSCGWTHTNVAESIMDDLIMAHLIIVGVTS